MDLDRRTAPLDQLFDQLPVVVELPGAPGHGGFRLAGRDLREPRPEPRGLPQAAEVPPGRDERVLHEVLRLVTVP